MPPRSSVSDVWLAELARLLPELRDRYPDLPVPTRDEALGHSRLFEATARLLQAWAARRPLVLLLDDMHWADTATRDLVLYLAQSLAERPAPILLLLTLRAGAETFPDPQSTWVMALKRTGIPLTTLGLAPFTQEETQRFVQALALGGAAIRGGAQPRNRTDAFRARLHHLSRAIGILRSLAVCADPRTAILPGGDPQRANRAGDTCSCASTGWDLEAGAAVRTACEDTDECVDPGERA